jgi:hypothetical protein
MADSPSYLIDNDHVEPEFSTLRRTIPEFISDGVLVPDTTMQAITDALELAWGLIANAYDGDWGQATVASGWKPAAERWRDEYHRLLDALKSEVSDDEAAT